MSNDQQRSGNDPLPGTRRTAVPLAREGTDRIVKANVLLALAHFW